MKLSILIATIGPRNDSFIKLIEEHLMPRVGDYDIEVIAYWNNGEISIGEIRQKLLEEAKGDYVCFIDDDDMVPDYYCSEIINALGEDYVGFQVELFEGKRQMQPVFHSIKHNTWSQDQYGYYRGVTHLNPIRRELALQGSFGLQGIGEDATWARSVTPHVKTENYISRVMYYYQHDAENTTFGGIVKPKQKHKRPEYKHPQFRWHPESLTEGIM